MFMRLNGLSAANFGVTYWRDGDREVDFVVSQGTQVWAIEVKSGRPGKWSGVSAFKKRYPKAQVWLVGADGVKLEEFFRRPALEWFA